MSSDLFKNQLLHATLVTAQQNVSNFHSSTTAFCAMANKPAPRPINLPAISSLPDAWITLLPEDPTESSVTGKSENANNKDEAENDGGQEQENVVVEKYGDASDVSQFFCVP